MSTAKNCPKSQKKQTPPPPPVPVPAKVPCPRDQQAYALHLQKRTQRWIADKLKCTQPTVLRGIRRMEAWLAKTLPEDRGEYTATEKLRLAMAKHERLMEAVIKMSLREFRRSRKTIPMKKQITTKDGVDEQGDPVKIRIEEWKKPQIGRKGFIDSAAKASHEITVLAAGWLGPGSGSISMAEVMDPEERDRWDRLVTTQKAQIEKLEERAQEGAAGVALADEPTAKPVPPRSSPSARQPVEQPRDHSSWEAPSESALAVKGRETPCGNLTPTRPLPASATPPAAPVSGRAENNLAMYHEIVQENGATTGDDSVCETARDASPPEIDPSQNLYLNPPKMGTEPCRAGCACHPAKDLPAAGTACPTPTPNDIPAPRWSDEERQEALDYHCQIHNLPPARLAQASGIPNPRQITPLEAIRRGHPYLISIDRTAEVKREWNRRESERIERLRREPF